VTKGSGAWCASTRALHGLPICKMRCTARAIDFKSGKGTFTWSYDPANAPFAGAAWMAARAMP